jgi:fatty-acyl-CoA synthase
VRLNAGESREPFAVAVESDAFEDPAEVRRIRHEVPHEVMATVDMRLRNVVVLGPGTIPKTPSGTLRRAHSAPLV